MISPFRPTNKDLVFSPLGNKLLAWQPIAEIPCSREPCRDPASLKIYGREGCPSQTLTAIRSCHFHSIVRCLKTAGSCLPILKLW